MTVDRLFVWVALNLVAVGMFVALLSGLVLYMLFFDPALKLITWARVAIDWSFIGFFLAGLLLCLVGASLLFISKRERKHKQ